MPTGTDVLGSLKSVPVDVNDYIISVIKRGACFFGGGARLDLAAPVVAR